MAIWGLRGWGRGLIVWCGVWGSRFGEGLGVGGSGRGNLAPGGEGGVEGGGEIEEWMLAALMESDGVLRRRIGACGEGCWWRSW